ncbi:DUF4317 family protein [Lactonifactor longoviformis]|uniref:DUF4317 family protein n=1 Tax=Lactonifactor longoviformis TaxID=341220 RepID=UPI0036F20D7B
MNKMNREDMLELTRRMTVKRNCFSRIAGAYIDEEGYIDGTFNTNFLKLSPSDQAANLQIAKAIPFANTNVNIKEYGFTEEAKGSGDLWQLFMGLKSCELKNDALLDTFYDFVSERYKSDRPYAVYLFFGAYDVPLKANDKEALWDSEEIYSFLIGAICPVHGEYEAEAPESGFLFPAFKNRSGDEYHINIYHADADHPHTELFHGKIRVE